MRPTAHAAADRFLRSPRSARPYVMGLAIAAAALATPASADVLQDGLRAAVTLWPAADPIQTVSSYFDGSMTLVASALRGVAKIASGQGVELIHPAREAARDAAVWLGLREPEAQTFFEVTLSKSAEFPAFAKNFCGERLAQGPVEVGMDFGAALAALSGAWEGLKLLKRGYDRILGRSPTPETPAARIEINLSLSGDRAEEFLQRSGLLDAARAENAPAPRSLAPAPCDCDKPDAAELVTRAEMRAWENASLIRSASAQAGAGQARISAAGHPAEGLVARRGAPTHDWLRNAFKPLSEGLQDLVSASRALRDRVLPANDNHLLFAPT